MKKHLLPTTLALLTVLAILGVPLALVAEKSSPDSDILALRKSVWVAWFAGDVKTLDRLLPDDGLFMTSDTAPWQTKAGTIEGSRKFHEAGGKLVSLDFPKTEIRRYGDAVILQTTYAFTIDENGKTSTEEGKGIEVFMKRDGKWIHPTWCLEKKMEERASH